MPGRRPIDINQQTHDARGNLKGAVTALPDHAYALRSGGLGQFSSTSSEQLAGVISDETGSGALVFANSPTLVTPTLGAATATSITGASGNLSITAAAGNNNVNLVPTGTGTVDVANSTAALS